jgi:putative RNA 2'-phosphotransferase
VVLNNFLKNKILIDENIVHVLSKRLSYILRHNPNRFNVLLDEEGWTNIDSILDALHNFPDLIDLKKEDLLYLVSNQTKTRFQISKNKIKATYGHTVPILKKNPMSPPDILYHGTSPKFVHSIMKYGLLKMKRQYVHLSIDLDTAIETGKRKDRTPAIIKVDSKTAYNKGVIFYKGSEKVWLSETIIPNFLKVI